MNPVKILICTHVSTTRTGQENIQPGLFELVALRPIQLDVETFGAESWQFFHQDVKNMPTWNPHVATLLVLFPGKQGWCR